VAPWISGFQKIATSSAGWLAFVGCSKARLKNNCLVCWLHGWLPSKQASNNLVCWLAFVGSWKSGNPKKLFRQQAAHAGLGDS
jgi:hypothetical protein